MVRDCTKTLESIKIPVRTIMLVLRIIFFCDTIIMENGECMYVYMF